MSAVLPPRARRRPPKGPVAEAIREAGATVEERRKFAEKHLVVKTGEPFRIPESRAWVLDEFWGPADGFKLWPVDSSALCDECKLEARQIVHTWRPHRSQRKEHLATGCKGLELQPIIITAVKLPRQEGKTSNGMGYDLSTIFKQRNKNLFFLAGASEDQTKRIFEENYQHAIEANPKLRKRCQIVGSKLYVPSTNSTLKLIPTSAASSMGSSLTHIRFDEARVIPAKVAAQLVPSIFARNGMECPIPGHYHVEGFEHGRKTCPICGSRLVPWFGRIIITSSAGELTGGETDWFEEMIGELHERPDPNCHVYMREDRQNPAISKTVIGVVERVLGSLPSMRDYIDVEVNNVARRKGDDIVTTAQLGRVMKPEVGNEPGSSRAAVGFLDTSLTVELTSLGLVIDDAVDDEEPWTRLTTARLDYWDPALLPGHVINEKKVLEHLDDYIPLFPDLRILLIDDRGMPWAANLVKFLQRNRPWGRIVKGAASFELLDSRIAWNLYLERIAAETILMPDEARIKKEFQGLKKKYSQRRGEDDDAFTIVDRNREKSHKDLTEVIAMCCLLAHLEKLRRRTGMSELKSRTGSSVLSRVMRPRVRGMNPNSF